MTHATVPESRHGRANYRRTVGLAGGGRRTEADPRPAGQRTDRASHAGAAPCTRRRPGDRVPRHAPRTLPARVLPLHAGNLPRTRLANAVDRDMVSAGWVPTIDTYFGRVIKARILGAVREAKGGRPQSESRTSRSRRGRRRPRCCLPVRAGCPSHCARRAARCLLWCRSPNRRSWPSAIDGEQVVDDASSRAEVKHVDGCHAIAAE